MAESLIVDFRRALEDDHPEEALIHATNYERTIGTVIDCSDDNIYPYMFRWASCNRVCPALGELYDLIRRGGGVTLAIATRPHSSYIGFVERHLCRVTFVGRGGLADPDASHPMLTPRLGTAREGLGTVASIFV
jgi:hypothetical protein